MNHVDRHHKAEKVQSLADVDTSRKIKNKRDYEVRLGTLQLDMLKIQQAYYRSRRKAVIVLEGWDAAGKGGAIRRITERLDPRNCKVWPIAAPTHREQGIHYLYRFWQRLPEPGQIAIFDRSWYGRVLVERVEGYATDPEWRRAYDEVNDFERMLADDDTRVVKIFMHITKKEQLKRFADRLKKPHKRWKLTIDDFRNREKWPLYEQAVNDMLEHTDTRHAPWHLISGNQKLYGRIAVMEIITQSLAQGVDLEPPKIDPDIEKLARAALKDLED